MTSELVVTALVAVNAYVGSVLMFVPHKVKFERSALPTAYPRMYMRLVGLIFLAGSVLVTYYLLLSKN